VTAAALLDLIDDGGVDVRELPADAPEVLDLLRADAAASSGGTAWTLFAAAPGRNTPHLTLGLSDDRGILSWWDGTQLWVPASTTVTGRHVDYVRAGHHAQFDAGREIPAEQVLKVTEEFLTTRQRPTGIGWKRED
jgi:Immunity protein Imm1